MKILNEPIGTTHAEYDNSPNGRGPYRCDECIHYHPVHEINGKGTCDHPEVKEDHKEGTIPDYEGKPLVIGDRCCKYFR